jgi:hypothetical protein
MHETKRSHHGAGSTLKRIIVLTSLIVGLAARESGTANPGNLNNGFLVDGVTLASN